MSTKPIDFSKLGIGWKIIGMLLIAYILFFTFAIFMRTISFAFKEVFIEAAYPFFLASNIVMVLCCLAMLVLLVMKQRGAIVAAGIWFAFHAFTIIKSLGIPGDIKGISYKYLFWVAAGPSVYVPIKFDPIVFQINIIGIAALLIITAIYKKTKKV